MSASSAVCVSSASSTGITETGLKLLTYYDFIIDHPYLSLIIISLSFDKALALRVSSC